MSICIRNVLLNGTRTDIAIEGNRIAAIAPKLSGSYEEDMDGSGGLALPAFYNTHTHSPMTLLRGFADDLELTEWLQNHIWPAEAHLTAEDIYWGSRLACLEMIHSGIVFFNDMYFVPQQTIRAVEDSGIRAAVGLTKMDMLPNSASIERNNQETWERREAYSSRIQLTSAPHSVYTVTAKGLAESAEFAQAHGLPLHVHVSETAGEVANCRAEHGGMSPVEYLDSLGVMTPRTLAAHSIHLTDNDLEIYTQRGVWASFNPCSNLKLCSGLFPFRKAHDAGVSIALGTDGNASNNNLSMFDEMKMAAMVAKLSHGGPTGCTAGEIYTAATRAGAMAFGLDAGILEPGRLADLILLDANHPLLTPAHDMTSNLVYSADTSCVSTVICDGKILMRNHVVEGEEEVIAKARECAAHLA